MNNTVVYIFLALNVAHFLGDFTPLNKWFIEAKRYGNPVSLVLAHGAVNGALYGLAIFCFAGIMPALVASVIETVTHTSIDVLKGHINRWFPKVDDNTNAIHWTVMGADQLLHQTVLIFTNSLDLRINLYLCGSYFNRIFFDYDRRINKKVSIA
jgi:hypothetical protein